MIASQILLVSGPGSRAGTGSVAVHANPVTGTLDVVRLQLSRSSVCMADDAYAPHEADIEFGDEVSLVEIIERLRRQKYLPTIGPDATWLVSAGRDGRPLAVVSERWDSPQMVAPVAMLSDPERSLYFSYLWGCDAAALLRDLRMQGHSPWEDDSFCRSQYHQRPS